MGTLDPTKQELKLIRDLMNEAFKHRGTKAKLYPAVIQTQDENQDVDFTRGNPVDINILFEEHPKKILREMGWLIPGERVPYLAHILALDEDGNKIEVTYGSLVEIPYSGDQDGYRTLYIGKVTTDSLYNLSYICTLTENLYTQVMNPVTREPVVLSNVEGNNFLKV